MKNNITLYVQGVNYISSSIPFLQWFIDKGYELLNVSPNYKIAQPDWLTKENTHSEQIVPIQWAANLNPFSKKLAVRELKKAIASYAPKYNIIVVGTSLGGLIATRALANFSGKEVSNLVLVGAINAHKHVNLRGIKVLNIYSRKDTLARLGTRMFAPINGSQELSGPGIVNIQIDNAGHDELFMDLRVSSGIYQNKTIGQAIYDETGFKL